jgi:hypothetical protein
MRVRKDLLSILAGLGVTVVLTVMGGSLLKTETGRLAFDCSHKVATHFLRKDVHIRAARSELDAFEPLVESVSRRGQEPQFTFRAQCGDFVVAGVSEIPPRTLDASYGISIRDQYSMNVHSVAIMNDLCLQNEGDVTAESKQRCSDPRVAAAYGFALITQVERLQSVRTLLEHRALDEMLATKSTPSVRSVTPEVLKQVDPFMAEFTNRLGTSFRLKKASALMEDADAAWLASRTLASKSLRTQQ